MLVVDGGIGMSLSQSANFRLVWFNFAKWDCSGKCCSGASRFAPKLLLGVSFPHPFPPLTPVML